MRLSGGCAPVRGRPRVRANRGLGLDQGGEQVDARGLRKARQLAGRLNFLPIAAFGLWSLPAKAFWLIVLGLVPWMHPVPAWDAVWPWFVGALLAGPPAFLLPRAFHQPRAWELRGVFYRRVGVELFRQIVANGDLVNRFVRARHRSYHVYGPELERLVPKSIFNERRHIAYLCWGFVTAYYAWAIGWDAWALWLAGTNVGANLYPAMLQRYTRARVLRLTRLGQRRPRRGLLGLRGTGTLASGGLASGGLAVGGLAAGGLATGGLNTGGLNTGDLNSRPE